MSGSQKPLVSVVGGGSAGLPERSEGERSEPERSGGRPAARVVPDPEVSVPARRRQFTAQEKFSLLEEAESCRASGTLGAFLRRHGLYSSHLAKWRQQRAGGGLAGLAPKRRGPAPKISPEQRRIRELEAKLARVERELATAQIIIDVQKK